MILWWANYKVIKEPVFGWNTCSCCCRLGKTNWNTSSCRKLGDPILWLAEECSPAKQLLKLASFLNHWPSRHAVIIIPGFGIVLLLPSVSSSLHRSWLKSKFLVSSSHVWRYRWRALWKTWPSYRVIGGQRAQKTGPTDCWGARYSGPPPHRRHNNTMLDVGLGKGLSTITP
jgi:hypothetical protein